MSKITVFCLISLIVASINSLPIDLKNTNLPKIVVPEIDTANVIVDSDEVGDNLVPDAETKSVNVNEVVTRNVKNDTGTTILTVDEIDSNVESVNARSLARNTVRPGMFVRSYAVELEPNVQGGSFSGQALIVVDLTQATREDELVFQVEDLAVTGVSYSLMASNNFVGADFDVDDNLLTIDTGALATMYTLLITFEGALNSIDGLYAGSYGNGESYVAMNLHPIHARRVFPCIDEPTEATTVTFSVNGLSYTHLISNSRLDDGSPTQFMPMGGPLHLWGIVAHNFVNINNPVNNVPLFGRSGNNNQDANQASVTINSVFTRLNEWTERDYFNIMEGVQDGRMHIIAVPDVSSEWSALSIVGIWEPYVFMQTQHSIMQRKLGMTKIAEGIARQWFGYVVFPDNWIYEWVVTGLGTYAAYDALINFQANSVQDDTLLDMQTIFISDVHQESLLQDAYTSALILEPDDYVFDEDMIRELITRLVKYKAPALLSMLRLILGGENDDFIHLGARELLLSRALQPITSLNLIDSINSHWAHLNNRLIDDLEEFLEPYIQNNGYPVVNVGLRQQGVLLTQERFGFSSQIPVTFTIPITYTTRLNPSFDNVYPTDILEATTTLDMAIGDEEWDWVLFNIQGRGYYRVNYDLELWERIIFALEDPDERALIHPMNRATLVDDALNLARAGRLDYDIAFRVVLTMEHETEYAPWKAFIRNMDFLRKRLVAAVSEDEDLDPDIYLRMVRRTIGSVENELGFSPETNLNEPAMDSLTRGIVMDHACRANYDPCIAAAIDWFYDPNGDGTTVNPDIPADLRPAVYCTMARVGGDEVRSALFARLDIETTMYERVVILESLACSQDQAFIDMYLLETIAVNSPYSVEERSRILKAVVASSYENANIALGFLTRRTNEIRNFYGGVTKLEEVIFAFVDEMAEFGLADQFMRWVDSINSNLEDSLLAAERASAMVEENLAWDSTRYDEVYEWIDENDANIATVSMFLLLFAFMLTIFNS